MGRPSKLTDAQKADIKRRLGSGETQRSLAKEFGVSLGTICKLFDGRSETIKTLAVAVARVESQVELLNIDEQVIVRDMANQHKALILDYTRGAALGLKTSNRLRELADLKTSNLSAETVETEGLRLVAALTDTANRASAMATTALTANKGNQVEEHGTFTAYSGVPRG